MITVLPTSKFISCNLINQSGFFCVGLREMLPQYLGELAGTGKWAIVDLLGITYYLKLPL